MSRMSMDFKMMPSSYNRYKLIFVVIDEATDFMVTITIYQYRSDEKGDALIEYVFSKYSIPEYMIMGQDCAFMSKLTTYLF